MSVFVAHVGDSFGASTTALVLAGVIVALGFALAIEHLHVKHGRLTRRQLVQPAAMLVAVATGALLLPNAGLAQADAEPQGLPDLISDPPFIWRNSDVTTPQGDTIRAMQFDGLIHNIGTGKLEIAGNPQVEGGMKQRVFDGTDWTDVAAPSITFENDDGHNHFHLNAAVEYSLWTADRTTEVLAASKVGFCLVDTEQVEEGYDSNYLIDDNNYCGVNDPDTTELFMGITPGWRDIYDFNVTMQWVDISNTQPGLYVVSATTDPQDQIVESNEDNNGIVFSENIKPVDGYVARGLGDQISSEPIQLKSNVYGQVGTRAFVIATGPTNGTLDVPVGMDITDTDLIRYTPNRGFSGSDSFSYYAHDTATPFPYEPTIIDVAIAVDQADDAAAAADGADRPPPPVILGPPSVQLTALAQTDITFELQDAGDADVRWFARDLPSGLAIDVDSGEIVGSAVFVDTFESTIGAWANGELTEFAVTWTVAPTEAASLMAPNDFSTQVSDRLQVALGFGGTPGASYTGTGLPEGATIVPNFPTLGGIPREPGVFTVQVDEIVDDEVVNTIEFVWTVRNTPMPAFPL